MDRMGRYGFDLIAMICVLPLAKNDSDAMCLVIDKALEYLRNPFRV